MAARLAARCLLAACLLCPAPALSAESVQTLALVDFAVRAPAGATAESAWLGPAISELMQAKLQLFGGARVLERQRVRTLLRKTKADAGASTDDPGALSGILPAEVLIAGSVSVDPQDPQRIRVQARAFEIETSKIVSEAAFSGTGDLAGLLKIAEDLAKTLADGLKLGYTPEQLAYAEPAKIDTLKHFVTGEEHLTAGRHREAIGSLQKALDGNEGRYYAAAHRLQGEAYQALAQSSGTGQEGTVREEYLKKFKEDAIIASGALFDLGLAYQANGMWQEAIGAFTDYTAVLGTEENPVRWSLSGHESLVLNPEDLTLHGLRFQKKRWARILIDSSTGKVVREDPLPWAVGPTLYDFDGGAAIYHDVLHWGSNDVPPTNWVAVVEKDGSLRWRWQIDLPRAEFQFVRYSRGRILVGIRQPIEKSVTGGRELSDFTHLVQALDPATGKLLNTVVYRGWSYEDLYGLDLEAGTISTPGGVYDLIGGGFTPATEKLERFPAGSYPPTFRYQRPTGYPGVSFKEEDAGIRLFQDGREVLFAEGCAFYYHDRSGIKPVSVNRGPIVLRRKSGGYLLVNPGDWTTARLYADFKGEQTPLLLAKSDRYLLFIYTYSPKHGEVDLKYGFPSTVVIEILNLVDARTGQLAAKQQVKAARSLTQASLVDGDAIIGGVSGGTQRLRLLGKHEQRVVPATEARLQIARCLIESGKIEEARAELDRIGEGIVQDPRANLLRMRIAQVRGGANPAAAYALKAMSSGGLEEKDIPACVAAVRRGYPLVRAALRVPVGGRLDFQAMAGPGLIVSTLRSLGRRALHFLTDARTGVTSTRDVSEMAAARTSSDPWVKYSGTSVFLILELNARPDDKLLRVDLATGERVGSGASFRGINYLLPSKHFLASVMEFGVGEDFSSLVSIDPVTLQVLQKVGLERTTRPVCSADGIEVFAGGEPGASAGTSDAGGDLQLLAVDTGTMKNVFGYQAPLNQERFAGTACDREAVYLVRTGEDYEAFRQNGRGAWFSVEALEFVSGRSLWKYESEGALGGMPLVEGDDVVIPAFEGRLSTTTVKSNVVFPGFAGSLPAKVVASLSVGEYTAIDPGCRWKRITLDRRTGKKTAEENLSERDRQISPLRVEKGSLSYPRIAWSCSPEGPHLLFPGTKKTVRRVTLRDGNRFLSEPTGWWNAWPNINPVRTVREDPEGKWHVLFRQTESDNYWTTLVEGDTVYESIGGGFILVKDFDRGMGLRDVYPLR